MIESRRTKATNLHQAGMQADWKQVPAGQQNVWQRAAARTHGAVTPGNVVSVAGMAMVLLGLAIMARHSFWTGFGMIVGGRLADILDGVVADRTATKSPLGEALDSAIDKIVAVAMLVLMVDRHWAPIVFIVCVGLQLVINSVLALAARSRGIHMHPSVAGKYAAFAAWAALLAFPVAAEAGRNGRGFAHYLVELIAYVLAVVFVVLSVKAAIGYYRSAIVSLKSG